MATNILHNPNSLSSSLLDNLQYIHSQRKENAIGDNKVRQFQKDPSKIEPFIDINKYMLDKLIFVGIIIILVFFIYFLRN